MLSRGDTHQPDLGLSVFALIEYYQFWFVFWTAVFCLVGRACHVYPLSYLLNKRAGATPISRNQQHMIWYSGLRGAVAFALSKSFPGEKQNEVTATAMIIILMSIFFMGGGTVGMLNKLGIPRLTVRGGGGVPPELRLRCIHHLTPSYAVPYPARYRRRRSWRSTAPSSPTSTCACCSSTTST
jgi:hypothetical protein